MTKKVHQEKKSEDPKGYLLKAHKKVTDSYESKRKQELVVQEVVVVSPAPLST
jgi:hypothetical protein